MISCIITTYKRPIETLSRAVESVLNQTFKDLEIIVINDYPEDVRLAEIIKNKLYDYNANIIYHDYGKNMGACYARNAGLKLAHGEYVAFLDDDDEWEPSKIEIQYKAAIKENADFVFCAFSMVFPNGSTKYIDINCNRLSNSDLYYELLCNNVVGSCSFPLIKTSAVRKVGGFRIGLRSSQDQELWIRLAKEYKTFYCSQSLVKYYYSNESITRNINNVVSGLDEITEVYRDIFNNDSRLYNKRMNYLAVRMLSQKNIHYFFKYWFKAIKIKPFSKWNCLVINKLFGRIISKK